MQAVAYSESVICAITEGNSFIDIASQKGYDLLMPKSDSEDNIYFIKKPYKNKPAGKSAGQTLLDIVLFPYWLIYGIGRVLVFLANLSKKSDKTAQNTTAGANPSVENIKSEREIYLQSELIDVEREEKRNKKSGDKNPGFAPKNFELWKQSTDGKQTLVRKGVLAYDITPDNKVVYSNGRYIILKDGEIEIVLKKDRIINNFALKIDKTSQKQPESNDPFGG